MALEFPVAPAIGDEFIGPFGEIYTWDGDSWTLTTTTTPELDAAGLISNDAGNIITTGSDALLFSPSWPGLSTDANNLMTLDANGMVYLSPYPTLLTWQIPGGSIPATSIVSPSLAIVPWNRGIQSLVTAQAEGLPGSPGTATFTLESVNMATGAVTTIGGFITGGSIAGNGGLQSMTSYYGGAPVPGGMLRFNTGNPGFAQAAISVSCTISFA